MTEIRRVWKQENERTPENIMASDPEGGTRAFT